MRRLRVPALLLLAGFKAFAQSPVAPGLPPDVAAVMQGLRMTSDDAAGAEKMLASSPDNLNVRLKLIGYYGGCGPDPCPLNTADEWAKHVFWMIDHHPKCDVLGMPLPPIELFHANRGWSPTSGLINEYRDHWEQAVATNPRDTVVLYHAALALFNADPNRGVSLARKAVELDSTCGLSDKNTLCRGQLGGMYGMAILGLGGSTLNIPCLTKSPNADQAAAKLREEMDSVNDPEILVSAGLAIKGRSQFYHERCGGDAEEAFQFGVKLVRKAVAIDPSLIVRLSLTDMLNQLDRFQGAWDNTNAETGGIAKIRIDTAKVQVYGYCRPDPCDWGQAEVTAYGPGMSANPQTEPKALLTRYENASSETILIMKPSGTDELEVESYTRFINGSHRAAYMNRETFRRGTLPTTRTSVESKLIQNIPPEEMWKRVKECVFPTYPGPAFNDHVTGTVDIGLGISPKGEVANYRVLSGHHLLVPSAVEAVRQWRFQPNIVQGELTWSRIRALARFNADGTTAVDFAPGILADDFGGVGTPRPSALELPRPATAPPCSSVPLTPP